MDDEHEDARIKERTNEMASLISFLNFGSEKMHVDECVELAREEIVDV
jgi:hypothetical protein